jgi:tetratricopeptide (TPR) repeat protein
MGENDDAARALHGLGNALRRLNEGEAAERAYGESLELATRLGDDPLRALNLTALGLVASGAKRLEEADERLKEAVALFRSSSNPWGLAIALNSRAQNLERLGQLLRARELYQESLEIKRELEDRRGIAITLAALGRLAPALGEPETARALLTESLSVNRELGDAWGCAVTLGALADRWLADGEVEPALEAAAAAHEALNSLGGGASRDAAESGRVIEAARSQLSADQADAIEARGRETALMEACDAAMSREPAPSMRRDA